MSPKKRLDESERRRRTEYSRAESAFSERAAAGIGTLQDRHAFVTRWGTPEEIAERGMQLGALIAWWNAKGPVLQPKDVEAVEALELAQDRLRDLHDAADTVVAQLQAQGYILHPKTRLLVEDVPGKRGPKARLFSRWVVEVYDHLVEVEGWPLSNNDDIRRAIAKRLADTFHPDLLDPGKGGKIYAAVNGRLQPERERTNRGKRKPR